MRLNISSLTGRRGAFFKMEEEISSDFVKSSPEIIKVLGPIRAKLTVTNTGEGFLVTGDLTLEIAVHCSRCLKPLNTKIEAYIEEEFLNHPSEELDEDFADEELLVEGNDLDLTSLIRGSILMGLPMKPVCDPDCPGLCPTCGAVLAEEACDCVSPEIDIRLAPLSKLLKISEPESSERRKDHGSTKKETFESKD